MKLTREDQRKLITFLKKDNRIAAAYLLGSAASNTMRPDSDVDIALLLKRGLQLNSQDLLELVGILTWELGRAVDVGFLSSSNLVYAHQVLTKGKQLFTKDPFYSRLIETTLLSMYLWFKQERKEVIDAYRTWHPDKGLMQEQSPAHGENTCRSSDISIYYEVYT